MYPNIAVENIICALETLVVVINLVKSLANSDTCG